MYYVYGVSAYAYKEFDNVDLQLDSTLFDIGVYDTLEEAKIAIEKHMDKYVDGVIEDRFCTEDVDSETIKKFKDSYIRTFDYDNLVLNPTVANLTMTESDVDGGFFGVDCVKYGITLFTPAKIHTRRSI